MGLVSEYTAIILLSLCCAVVILLFLCLAALLKVIRLKRRYDIFSGSNRRPSRNIEEKLNIYQEEVEEVNVKYEKVLSIVEDINKNMQKCIQKVGIVRYNPYKDVGGNLCFAVAFLDGNNTGVVINGLHSRTGSFTYAKPVILGTSTYVLTSEEQQAIEKAITTSYIPGDREIVMERKIKVYHVKERGVLYRAAASQEKTASKEEGLEDTYDDIEEVLEETFDDSKEEELEEETDEEIIEEKRTENENSNEENIEGAIKEETDGEETEFEQEEEQRPSYQPAYRGRKEEKKQKNMERKEGSIEENLKKPVLENPMDIIDKISAEILQNNNKDKRKHKLDLDELLKEELRNKKERLKLKANESAITEDMKEENKEILDTDKLIEEAIKRSVLYHLVETDGVNEKNGQKANAGNTETDNGKREDGEEE